MSRIIPGGPMLRPKATRKPAPAKMFPGGPMQRPHQQPGARLYPGTPMYLPKPAKKAKKAGHAKKAKRGLARSASEVACCAAEALAASLRLAGAAVADADVLALYWHTADGPDAGASILATLEAASEFGLGGARPLTFEEVMPRDALGADSWSCTRSPGLHETRAGLILGVDLPGPHTVLDDGEAWWSWGEPLDPASFPAAVIGEAWAVTWS